MWLGLAHFSGDFAAVHSGHGVVEDDNVDGMAGEDLQARIAIDGGEDLVACPLQKDLPDAQPNYLIINA